MKIALVTHYAKLYGANRSLLGLIDGLQAYGVKSHVVAPGEGPITEELSKRNVPFYTIPFKRWMSKNRWKAPARLGLNLAVLPFIARQIRLWNVDLVHTNSSVTPVGALAAGVLSIPHTWHIREFGDLDYDLQHDMGKAIFRTLMCRSAATIAVSKAVREHVLSGIDVPCHVVYNGVISQDRLEKLGRETKEQNEDVSSPYTFALVGQISPAKGQKQALLAFHRLKQDGKVACLLIAGSGKERHVESLRRLRQALNLEKEVSLLGYVSDPFEVYQRADAVLMCSPHEAMGRVTAEAMVSARPVIGYDSDGTAELINDGHSGLLYDGSTKDLADSMNRFVDNPDLARSFGQNGWEKARRTYTNEVYARHVYKGLSKVMQFGEVRYDGQDNRGLVQECGHNSGHDRSIRD